MNNVDLQYQNLLKDILENGVRKNDRTNTGTISVFGRMLRFDLSEGFPLLTTKKIHTKSVIHELLWFLKGDTNVKYLNENGVTIWDEWARPDGSLGPVYGKQWVKWTNIDIPKLADGHIVHKHINQIQQMVDRLKTNPDCRRMIVSAWNVGELSEMALMPCHYGFQLETHELTLEERTNIWFNTRKPNRDVVDEFDTWTEDAKHVYLGQNPSIPTRKLTLMWNQRSVDTFLGLPFNIASYAILLHMFAAQTNMVPGDLICSLGDTHIYLNHFEQVAEQLSREARPLPELWLNPEVKSIFDYEYEDIKIHGYNPHPVIKAPIAI